jgi:hypothetical protein
MPNVIDISTARAEQARRQDLARAEKAWNRALETHLWRERLFHELLDSEARALQLGQERVADLLRAAAGALLDDLLLWDEEHDTA